MILDIILAVIIAINILLGLKRGLLVMLGRLLMFLIIVAATLVLLGPLTDTLAKAPFIVPLEQQFGDSVLKPLVSSAANLGAAVDNLGLPAMLADLMKSQLPALNSTLAEGYPQLTSVLFHFLLSAIVFVLMFIIIIVVISPADQCSDQSRRQSSGTRASQSSWRAGCRSSYRTAANFGYSADHGIPFTDCRYFFSGHRQFMDCRPVFQN